MNKTIYRAFFNKRTVKKKAGIGLLILAILTGSFIVQTKFIVSENKRLAELATNDAPPAAQNAETKPEIAENAAPNLTISATQSLSDKLQNSSAPQNPQAVKIVLKNSNQQTENVQAPNISISKNKSASKVERLRRAERILTGF